MSQEAFKHRHNFYPNTGLHIYGHIDYMIMKSCPLSSAYKLDNDHCSLCKTEKYYLKDHLNTSYPIITNEDCTTRILSNRPISLTSKIDELKDLKIENFIIDFTIESCIEINRVLEAYENKTTVYNKDFFGHYLNKVE